MQPCLLGQAFCRSSVQTLSFEIQLQARSNTMDAGIAAVQRCGYWLNTLCSDAMILCNVGVADPSLQAVLRISKQR